MGKEVIMSPTVIEEAQALQAYNAPDGVLPLIEEIENRARAVPTDATSEAGRKEISSLAYKVARSKTLIDEIGKSLTEDWKAKSKAVDEQRKMARERLDALKEEVRKPLTDYENQEKARVDNHRNRIAAITAQASFATSAEYEARINELNQMVFDDFQEFQSTAEEVRDRHVVELEQQLDQVKAREAEQAELTRLRAEKEAQERREREARLVAEAEARAKAEAQAAVERAERDKAAALERATLAERDAQERATRAVEEDRKRAEAEEAARQKEAAARAADIEHRRRINQEILADIMALGLSEDMSKMVIRAISLGEVRNLKIVL